MQANKSARRLGRGLDSLVGRMVPEPNSIDVQPPTTNMPAPATPPNSASEQPSEPSSGVRAAMIAVESISPNPHQPRQRFGDDDLAQLADSIRTNGFVQPIVVRPKGKWYQIVAGERRWRAAKKLNMASVPVLIREATDEQMVELALVENIQREDLNAVDRAKAYRAYADKFQITSEQIAARLGEDRSTVSNYLRILELHKSVQEMVVERRLSMGHARSLLGILDPKRQLELAEAAARSELSVRALEEIVRRERGGSMGGESAASSKPSARVRGAHLKDMEERFEKAVKTGVRIHEGKRRGTGRITIEYYSLHDFERIAEQLGVQLD